MFESIFFFFKKHIYIKKRKNGGPDMTERNNDIPANDNKEKVRALEESLNEFREYYTGTYIPQREAWYNENRESIDNILQSLEQYYDAIRSMNITESDSREYIAYELAEDIVNTWNEWENLKTLKEQIEEKRKKIRDNIRGLKDSKTFTLIQDIGEDLDSLGSKILHFKLRKKVRPENMKDHLTIENFEEIELGCRSRIEKIKARLKDTSAVLSSSLPRSSQLMTYSRRLETLSPKIDAMSDSFQKLEDSLERLEKRLDKVRETAPSRLTENKHGSTGVSFYP
jgi:hypothetical protein